MLLNLNEVVSTDRLIDAHWGAEPPKTAAKSLQVLISQLRRLLEPERKPGASGNVLVTRLPGYVLHLDPDQLDLDRFRRLAEEGRAALGAGDPEGAAAKLGDALALWRGDPLADLTHASFAQREISRLEEMRLAALEARIEADLERGCHAEVIGELEHLVAREPLRERPRGQLMLALYRAGRQADALEVYREGRRALIEELGMEPGKSLQDLHASLLDQDASLEAPVRSHGPGAEEAGQRAVPETRWPHLAADEFVGRDAELRELEAALEGALSGRGSVFLIGGEPGIGKSRLAAELAERARALEATVLWGRCWEAGGGPAYWPWVQSLRAYVSAIDPGVLRDQLGPRGGMSPTFSRS